MGDLLTRQVTECFGFKPDGSYSMRHLPVGHDEPLRAEMIAFLDAVRSGGAPAVTGEEGVASLEIATRCLETPAKPAASSAPTGPRRVDGPRPVLDQLKGFMNKHMHADPVPFIDIGAQRRRLGRSIAEAVGRGLEHCQFVDGPEVAQLETRLADFSGAKHVVTCASGTDALLMVL